MISRTIGVDFAVPAPAAEDAIMANFRLHVVRLHILPQTRAKVLRGEGLAEAANIVPLAFDGQQRGALGRAGLTRRPCTSKLPRARAWSWKISFTVSR